MFEVGLRPFFAYSDLVALGPVRTILERVLRVPEDVAVVVYDDIDDWRYSTPTISTISPDKARIAAEAVDRLLWRIEQREPMPGQELAATYSLIARESTLGRAGQSMTR